MAVHGRYTRIFVNQFDFSGDNNGLTFAVNSTAEDVTRFQATARQFMALEPGFSLEQAGYWTGPAAGTQERELYTLLGADTAEVAALFGTDTAACPAYVFPDTGTAGITINSPATSVITFNGTWMGNKGCYRCLRIFSGTIAATGEQTSVDFGAAGTVGGVAYLFIQVITGTATNATVDIESSATVDGAYASEGTFTFSAVGCQSVVMAATVNRWLRLNCTDLGGATSFYVVGLAGIGGVTYTVFP